MMVRLLGLPANLKASASFGAFCLGSDRMSVRGTGCVKTSTSRECAELFSLFSYFDGDCQTRSFVIQRNRDKLSTRKFDVGVFTPPGSKSDDRAKSAIP